MSKLSELQKQQADYEAARKIFPPPDKYSVGYGEARDGCKKTLIFDPELDVLVIYGSCGSYIGIHSREILLLVKALTDFCGETAEGDAEDGMTSIRSKE